MTWSARGAATLTLGVVLSLGCGASQPQRGSALGPASTEPQPTTPVSPSVSSSAAARATAPREAWTTPQPKQEKLADAVGASVLVDPTAELVELRFAFDAGSRRDGEYPGMSWLVATELCELVSNRTRSFGVRPKCSSTPEAIVLRVSTLPGDAAEVARSTVQAARALSTFDERSLRTRLSHADDDELEPRELAERLALRHLMVLTFAPHPAAWRFAADVQEGPFGRRAFQAFVERHVARGGLEIVAVGPIELEALRAAIGARDLAGRQIAELPTPGEREERQARRKAVLIDRGPSGTSSVTTARLVRGEVEIAAIAAQVAALRAESLLASRGLTCRVKARATDLGAFGVLVALHATTSTERAPTTASVFGEAFAIESPAIGALAAEAHARATDEQREAWSSAAASADAIVQATTRRVSFDVPLPDESDVVTLSPSLEQLLDDARRSDGLVVIDGDAGALGVATAASLGVLDLLDPRRGMHRVRSIGPASKPPPEEPTP